MNDLIKSKTTKLKYLHIALIIIGTIFISLSIFHTNLWFDESYSVGLASYSFKDIWIIGGNDVHPVLYYCILHILNLIFGNDILVYRIFSTVCMAILGLIGFTHVRKDFGEKVGFLFTFFVFFFPVNLAYAGEIRMYSLAMLLVTLTCIYAYRIYRGASMGAQRAHLQTNSDSNIDFSLKNWMIFAICSLAAAYTHYYALMASGLINLFLMMALIINCVKNKKFSNNMIAFIVFGIIQIVLYIPWLLSLLLQMGHVSKGFWIGFHFPDTLIELFLFPFTGNLSGINYVDTPIAVVWSLLITVYMIILYIKDKFHKDTKDIPLQFNSFNLDKKTSSNRNIIKEEMRPATLSIKLFLGIVVAAGIISLVWKPILYARYLLCVIGPFIFFLSYTMVRKGNKYINVLVCIFSILISIYMNLNLININYDESNEKPMNYIKEDILEDDIILFNNDGSGFVVTVNFPENSSYFYDKYHWNCEEAYKAFSKDFNYIYDLDFLENYTGRVWIINDIDYSILDEVKDRYDVELIKQEMFLTQYKTYKFSISLIEK